MEDRPSSGAEVLCPRAEVAVMAHAMIETAENNLWGKVSKPYQYRMIRAKGHGKRNKKVAVKLRLRALTVLRPDLCSPTHHSPSSL